MLQSPLLPSGDVAQLLVSAVDVSAILSFKQLASDVLAERMVGGVGRGMGAEREDRRGRSVVLSTTQKY